MKALRVLIAGAVLQLCLGTVYAFSYFQKPLMAAFGWNNAQVAWVFSLALFCLGCSAALAAPLLKRFGPRPLALTGILLYAGSWIAAGVALQLRSLPLLQALFGMAGGIGLGLGYVTPVATVVGWFPRRKGLAAGIVVMGFGLGALLMSKLLAPFLMQLSHNALPIVFRDIGLLLLALGIPAALLLARPPVATSATAAAPVAHYHSFPSRSFIAVWTLFFCNITAGVVFIAFQSPLFQDFLSQRHPAWSVERLAAQGATLIALSALCNGLGRLIWGRVSDRLGSLVTFRVLLLAQVGIFLLLMTTAHQLVFAIGVCAVLLCYGGGFGAMPSLIVDLYGPVATPRAYGLVLTAWGVAGMLGPAVAAYLRDHALSHNYLFAFAAAMLLAGFVASRGLAQPPHLVPAPEE